MPTITKTYSLAELPAIARWALEQTAPAAVLAFYGAMGTGKTTLIKEICAQLQVADTVTSPTFALINEYAGGNAGAIPVYHFDFYRIRNAEELLQLGVEEYFESGCRCLIEWAELAEPLLPPDAARIYLHETPQEGVRQITINH